MSMVQEQQRQFIDTINFSCALAPGGTPVDFDKVVITYSNSSSLETLARGSKDSQPQLLDSGQLQRSRTK